MRLRARVARGPYSKSPFPRRDDWAACARRSDNAMPKELPRHEEREPTADAALDHLLHDLKQPLNFIKIVAQDLRIDAMKDRLDLSALPRSLAEIEAAVDELANQIDQLRDSMRPTTEIPTPVQADPLESKHED